MAYTNIDDPSAYFQTATYTGTGSSGNAITNDGNSDLQPDLVWIKQRNGQATQHQLVDSTRGTTKYLEPNAGINASEITSTDKLTSFNTDGFTLGADASNVVNQSGGYLYAGWQWKCNGGTTSSNTSGTITSTVQANTDAGLSIVTYTGNQTSGQTIGHGLGVTPDVVISKSRNATYYYTRWYVYHKSLSTNYHLFLDYTVGEQNGNGNYYTDSNFSSTVFGVGNDPYGPNVNNNNYVAYCFAEKQGYSKFGKYTGNGNANGPFVYTGFKPAFVLIKNASATTSWRIFDTKRLGYNPDNNPLYANGNPEGTADEIDIYSNGFKAITTNSEVNGNGNKFIYMAFAENPFVTSTGIPTTAR